VTGRLSSITRANPQTIASATLTVETPGIGFTEITSEARDFLRECQAGDGLLLIYLRHTSASLTIQENADPDVQRDLIAALDRVAPENAPWVHDVEGPDDMPAHVKAMLNGVSLQIPVQGGKPLLGTWQGVYLIEHRRAPHRREIVLQFIGSARYLLESAVGGSGSLRFWDWPSKDQVVVTPASPNISAIAHIAIATRAVHFAKVR
jgi:secondary thiamine-phosphate synthase enzyme